MDELAKVDIISLLALAGWLVQAGYVWYTERRRARELAAIAARLGLHYEHEDEAGHLASACGFLDKPERGHDKHSKNVISGAYCGHPVTAFDLHYTTGPLEGNDDRTSSFFILHLASRFPNLMIRTETLPSKVVQLLGFEDIDFESHEFSRRYEVRSADRKFAYAFCNARMIEYLLEMAVSNLEVEDDCILLRYEAALEPRHVERELDRLVRVRELMPDYLFKS